MYVLASNGDWTVDVNPHSQRDAVPLDEREQLFQDFQNPPTELGYDQHGCWDRLKERFKHRFVPDLRR